MRGKHGRIVPRQLPTNEQVAQALIDAELRQLRMLPYSELVALIGKPSVKEILGEDTKLYQLEIEVFWDSKRGGDVRVMVADDDRGWKAFHPLTDDFIMRPDGTFVGESFGGY
jgi:hypothetical protein